jgi:parvulin-like peptidyl-prolyl isomerase
MTTIYLDATEHAETQQLVKSAIEGEIVRLEMALATARQRLAPFEEKYGVTSEQFMATMAAEDLEGRDDEYVQWAGEYQLWLRLQQKVNQLRGIEYRDSSLLRLH